MKRNKSRYISAILLSAFTLTSGAEIKAQNKSTEIKKTENLSPKLEILLKAALSKPFTESVSIRLKNAWLEDSGLEALDSYLEKISENKADPDKAARACALLAMISESEGYDKRAIELFTKAIELKKDWAEAMGAYASLLIRTAHYEDAAAMLEKALVLDSSEENKLRLGKDLGRAFAKSGNAKKAIEVWKKCAKSNVDDFEAAEEILDLEIDEGILDEADKFCTELTNKAPSEFKKVSLMVKSAEIRKNRRDLNGAIDAYYAALEKISSGSWLERDILRNLEKCSESLGKTKDLLAKYDTFIEQNPARVEVARSRAKILMDSGDMDKAVSALTDLVKKMPSDRSAKDLLAEALISTSRNDEALALLDETARQSASDADIMMKKAALEHKMKLDAECAKSVDEYIKRTKESELSMTRAANYLKTIGLKKEADDVFRRMLKTYPASVEAAETYAEYLKSNGKDAEAVALLEKVASAAEMDGILRISGALVNMKKPESALKVMKSREGDFGKQFKYVDELSRVYEVNGDSDNAVKSALELMRLAVEGNEFDLAARRVLGVMKKAGRLNIYKDDLLKKEKLNEPEYCLLLEILRSSQDMSEKGKALETADKALNEYPKSVALLEFKLKLCRSAKDSAGIRDCVTKLIAVQPAKASWGYRELANLAYGEGKFPEAMSWLEKWRRQNPNLRDVPILEAKIILGEKADTLRAKDTLLRAWAKFPDDREIPRMLVQIMDGMGDSDGIMSVLWRLYDIAPDAGAKTGVIRDMALYAQRIPMRVSNENQYSGIIARLRARMESDQKNPIYPLSLAEVFKTMGYTDQRRSMLMKAAELKGDLVPTLHEIARMDEENGDYEGAVENLKKAVSLDKTTASKAKLADFYIKTGCDEDALPLMKEIVLASGDNSKVMDTAVSLAASRNVGNASGMLKEYLDRNPDDTGVMYLYASILLQKKETVDRALEIFKELAVMEDPPAKTLTPGDPNSIMGGINNMGYGRYSNRRSVYAGYYGYDVSAYLLNGSNVQLSEKEKNEISEITKLTGITLNLSNNKNNWAMIPEINNIINSYNYSSRHGYGMALSVKSMLPADTAEMRMMATAALSAFGKDKDVEWKKETLEFLKNNNIAYAELKFRPDMAADRLNYRGLPSKELDVMRKKSPEDKVLKILWGVSLSNDVNMTKEQGEAAYREFRDEYPRIALQIAQRFSLGTGYEISAYMNQVPYRVADPFRNTDEKTEEKAANESKDKARLEKETTLFKDIMQLADKLMNDAAEEAKKKPKSAPMNAYDPYGGIPYPYNIMSSMLIDERCPAEIKALALEAVQKKLDEKLDPRNAYWYQNTAGSLVINNLKEKKYSEFIDILFAHLQKLGEAQILAAEEQANMRGVKSAAGEEKNIKDYAGCLLPMQAGMGYNYYNQRIMYSRGYSGMGGGSYIDVFSMGYMFFNNIGNGYQPQLIKFFPPAMFPVGNALMQGDVLQRINALKKATGKPGEVEIDLNTGATAPAASDNKENKSTESNTESEAIWNAALEKKLPDDKLLVLAVMCGKDNEVSRIMNLYASADIENELGIAKRFNAAAYMISQEEYYKAAKLINEIINSGKIRQNDKIMCSWAIIYCNAMENIDRNALTAKTATHGNIPVIRPVLRSGTVTVSPVSAIPSGTVTVSNVISSAPGNPDEKKTAPKVSKLTDDEKKELKGMASAGAAYLKSFMTVTDQKRNLVMVLAVSGMKDEAKSLFAEVTEESTKAGGNRYGNVNLAWVPPPPPNTKIDLHRAFSDACNSDNKQEIAKTAAKMISSNLRQNMQNGRNSFFTSVNLDMFRWQADMIKNKKCVSEFLEVMKPGDDEKNALKQAEYAFALELVGKTQDAITEYEKILEKYKNNTFVISRLMELYSEKDAAKSLSYAKMLMKDIDAANMQIYYVSNIRNIGLFLTVMEMSADSIMDKADISNYNLQNQIQQMFQFLESARSNNMEGSANISIPALFAGDGKASTPNYNEALDKRRGELYLRLSEKALQIPNLAEIGFSNKYAYTLIKLPADKRAEFEKEMYGKGLEILNSMPESYTLGASRNNYNYGNVSNKTDKVFSEFMAEYAYKNGLEAELRAVVEKFPENKKRMVGFEILWLLDFIKAMNTLDAEGIKSEIQARFKPIDQKKATSPDYMAKYQLNQKTAGFMMKYAAQVVRERKMDIDIGKIVIISMLDSAQTGNTHQAMQSAGRYISELADNGDMSGIESFCNELIDKINQKIADTTKDKSFSYSYGNPQSVYYSPFIQMIYSICTTKAKAVPAILAVYKNKGDDIPENYREQMLNNMMNFSYQNGNGPVWADILTSSAVVNDVDTFDTVQFGKGGSRNSLLKRAMDSSSAEMKLAVRQSIKQKNTKTFGSEILLALIADKNREEEVVKVLNSYLPQIMKATEAQRRKIFSTVISCLYYGGNQTDSFIQMFSKKYPELCTAVRESSKTSDVERYEEIMSIKSIASNSNIWEFNQNLSGLINSLIKNDNEKAMKLLSHLRELYDDYALRNPWNGQNLYKDMLANVMGNAESFKTYTLMLDELTSNDKTTRYTSRGQEHLASSLTQTFSRICNKKLEALRTNSKDINPEKNVIFKETLTDAAKVFGDKLPPAVYTGMFGQGMYFISQDVKLASQLAEDLREMDKTEPNPILRAGALIVERKAQTADPSKDIPPMSDGLVSLLKDVVNDPKSSSGVKGNTLNQFSFIFAGDAADPRLNDIIDSLNILYRESLVRDGRTDEMNIHTTLYRTVLSLMASNGASVDKEKLRIMSAPYIQAYIKRMKSGSDSSAAMNIIKILNATGDMETIRNIIKGTSSLNDSFLPTLATILNTGNSEQSITFTEEIIPSALFHYSPNRQKLNPTGMKTLDDIIAACGENDKEREFTFRVIKESTAEKGKAVSHDEKLADELIAAQFKNKLLKLKLIDTLMISCEKCRTKFKPEFINETLAGYSLEEILSSVNMHQGQIATNYRNMIRKMLTDGKYSEYADIREQLAKLSNEPDKDNLKVTFKRNCQAFANSIASFDEDCFQPGKKAANAKPIEFAVAKRIAMARLSMLGTAGMRDAELSRYLKICAIEGKFDEFEKYMNELDPSRNQNNNTVTKFNLQPNNNMLADCVAKADAPAPKGTSDDDVPLLMKACLNLYKWKDLGKYLPDENNAAKKLIKSQIIAHYGATEFMKYALPPENIDETISMVTNAGFNSFDAYFREQSKTVNWQSDAGRQLYKSIVERVFSCDSKFHPLMLYTLRGARRTYSMQGYETYVNSFAVPDYVKDVIIIRICLPLPNDPENSCKPEVLTAIHGAMDRLLRSDAPDILKLEMMRTNPNVQELFKYSNEFASILFRLADSSSKPDAARIMAMYQRAIYFYMVGNRTPENAEEWKLCALKLTDYFVKNNISDPVIISAMIDIYCRLDKKNEAMALILKTNINPAAADTYAFLLLDGDKAMLTEFLKKANVNKNMSLTCSYIQAFCGVREEIWNKALEASAGLDEDKKNILLGMAAFIVVNNGKIANDMKKPIRDFYEGLKTSKMSNVETKEFLIKALRNYEKSFKNEEVVK